MSRSATVMSRSAKAVALRTVLFTAAMLASAGYAAAQDPVRFAGAPCVAPPRLHCPDKDCPSDRVINEGNVVELKTRRTYFLDYPCDLKPGEKVTFILALHGAGSYGNWQRNYFPLMDFKDAYRLVIATPNSPTTVWSEADDEYLHNIVDTVIAQIGKDNVKAFWLAGHSQGGMTSNPHRPHRLLQGQGRRLAQSVGRTAWRQPGPRQLRRHGAAAWRPRGRRRPRRRGARRGSRSGIRRGDHRVAADRLLLHLRNRPA
jgi:hypothetical protein